MEKGFKILELTGDLDDKYIYEASKPWKKQHRFFRIHRSWKIAAAGIILFIMAGCTLRYQEDVKAALQSITSWIGQALGIEDGDTDSYTNVVGKSISRDGITITLNEIVMDSKNLWIAYSDSEDLNNKNHTGKEQTKKDLISQDTDSDTQDAIEDKILFTEVRINGQEIHQGLGQRTVNNNALSENPITWKACLEGMTVRFFTAAGLAMRLLHASTEGKLDREIASIGKARLLIIEIGRAHV